MAAKNSTVHKGNLMLSALFSRHEKPFAAADTSRLDNKADLQ
jgi:hypothetical protein